MIKMSIVKIASDQNGNVCMSASTPTALKLAVITPSQRPYPPPLQIEKAANSWSTPIIRIAQPQAWR